MSRFIGADGNYLSVHQGRRDPSPVLLIVRAALKLMEAGEKLQLERGIGKHSLLAMHSHWGALGAKVMVARTHVEDVLMIWSKIKDNPRLYKGALDPYEDKALVEEFLADARRRGL